MASRLRSFAPRLASTSARAASPSRRGGRGSRSGRAAHPPARAPIAPGSAASCSRNDSRDLGEVLHVRDRTRSACRRWPARGCCARPTSTRLPPTKTAVATWKTCASSPMVSRTTTSARGSSSIVSSDAPRPSGTPLAARRRSTSSKCSGLRGATTSSGLLGERADALEAREHDLALAGHRAAGDDDRPRRRRTRKKRSTRFGAACRRDQAAGRASESNFRLPVIVMRDGGAPEIDQPLAVSSPCTQKRSTSASTRLNSGRDEPVARKGARRDAAVDHDRLDRRARGRRAAGSARSRFPSSRTAAAEAR